MVKLKLNLQLIFETQSSIFYHFTNSYFIAIVEFRFLIQYQLKKHFKRNYIQYFLLRKCFLQQSSRFLIAKLLPSSQLHYGAALSVINPNKLTIKLNFISKNGGKHKGLEESLKYQQCFLNTYYYHKYMC